MNKEALKQILNAMRLHTAETHPLVETERAMEAIEAELAQPEQEPVGEVLDERGKVDWISFVPPAGTLLYTVPPQRQPLTDEELYKLRTDAARYRKLVAMEADLVEPITIWHYLRNPDDLDTTHGIKEQP